MCALKVASAITVSLENESRVKELFVSLLHPRDDSEMPFISGDFDKFINKADESMLGRLDLKVSDFRLELNAVHSFEKNHCFALLIGGVLGGEQSIAPYSLELQKAVADASSDRCYSPVYWSVSEVLTVYRSAEEIIVGPCSYYLASTDTTYSDRDSIVIAKDGSKLGEMVLYAENCYFGSYFDTGSFV